jgi:hypothetical protein
MKLASSHLNSIKGPLAALLVVAVVGAGVVTFTRTQIITDERALATQETQLQEARTRFQRSGDERELIVRFIGPYQELRGRGLIGPEQRINWLDALRASNQQAQLFGAEYQIGAQQPYAFAQELNAPKLGMAQSIMKLSLRLAHEGDLMRFIRLLEHQNAGIFDINQCAFDRVGGAAAFTPRAQPNLSAECELAWITINPEPIERKP